MVSMPLLDMRWTCQSSGPPSTNAKLHNQRNENVLQAIQPHVMFSMTGVFNDWCFLSCWIVDDVLREDMVQ